MARDDMRSGRCAVCGGGEVYEVGQHAQLGKPGGPGMFPKVVYCEVLVCAACGFLQWYAPEDPEWLEWLRRKGRRVPQQSPE